MRKLGFFDAGEDLIEVLVGIGRFVDGILSSVEEDVVVVKFLIDRSLIEGALGGFSAQDSSRSMVDREA